VVVADGVTLTLPLVATLPTPLLMLTVEAPVVVQDSSDDCPLMMLVGEAANRIIAGFEAPTVTVTLAVTVWPDEPAAVRV
jgi:hypothetical protein